MPSGSLRCVLKVPSLDLVDRLRFSACRMSKLRSFLKKRLPAPEDAREGATFTISAEIRYRENQGYRWVLLCRWRAGGSVNKALDEARHNWKELDERGQELLLEEPSAADQIGEPIAAVPLARALADAADDEALVWAAANALAALRTNSATPILIEVLETGTPV